MKSESVSPCKSGLSRREFLLRTTALSVLAAAGLSRPELALSDIPGPSFPFPVTGFSASQEVMIRTVQMHLFPDDGNGPSAEDLNAYRYLTWALTEPDNVSEGDKAFIAKGAGWLNDLAHSEEGNDFVNLPAHKREILIEKISHSRAGRNWLSLLLYYLLEAVTLDPLYGGNANGAGWKWLEHQPGFPAPDKDTPYMKFTGA